MMMTKHYKTIKSLDSEFVLGFIQCLDGEKDPRILLLAFQLIPKLVQLFPGYIKFSEVNLLSYKN